MKRAYLLTLALALCGIATVQAEFNPTPGVMYALRESVSGLYFSFAAPNSTSTAASFQETPAYFYIVSSDGKYSFEDASTDGRYIGQSTSNAYDVGTGLTWWTLSEADEDGYVLISGGNGYLGHDNTWEVGTGIYTSANENCNRWLIEEATLDADGWELNFTCTDDRITLTGYSQEGGTALTIPDGLFEGAAPVVTLADDFLKDNTTVASIVLPATLEQMGNFGGCTNLTSITFTSNPKVNGTIADGVTCHLVLDDDGAADFHTGNANTYHTATYRRQLPDGVYGSIMLPFAPDAASLENYSFYALSASDDEGLTFTEVETPRANTPYLYAKKSVGEATPITAAGVTIADPASLVVAYDTWQAVGSYTTSTISVADDAYYYGISSEDNLFYHVTARIKAKPFRAYFKNTDTNGQAAPKLHLRIASGEATAVGAPNVEADGPAIVYDLLGRRVANPAKGVYIVGGRKVVIR